MFYSLFHRQGKGAISEKAIQPYLLLLKPEKISIIVLHELVHILMQSPAGNAYTFCCENVVKIIKSEAIAKIESDKKRRSKKKEIFVTAPLPDTDLVNSTFSPNFADRLGARYYL